ncbi:CRISPR associated protein Cas6 [Clostridiales bacterium CHKCI001]|nr:CRISPR associated protein Cas6 [Clostridiales bacterium CHKCI001]
MKYKLIFPVKEEIILPIQYQHILQSALLAWIDDSTYQTFLHDTGFSLGKRSYKLYTFSKIYGKFELDTRNKKIIFRDAIHLYLSSCDQRYLTYTIKNIISNRPLVLGNYALTLDRVEYIEEVYEGNSCNVRTLSPIAISSTLTRADGAKKRYYYNPKEREYSNMLRDNLIRKYKAFYEKDPADSEFHIELIRKGKESLVFYKKEAVRAWNGVFKISGSKELIELALNAGLGERNSAGFGCVMKIE